MMATNAAKPRPLLKFLKKTKTSKRKSGTRKKGEGFD